MVFTGTDTFFLDVKLNPRPVTMTGLNVQALPPEIIKPKLFVPRQGDGIYCLYGNSMTPPIGILISDDALYMVALEPTIIDSQKYVRLWLLYKNLSGNPCDFDPLRTVRLGIKGNGMIEQEVAPSLPSEVIPAVDTQKIVNGIPEEFGTTLEALAPDKAPSRGKNTTPISFCYRAWHPGPFCRDRRRSHRPATARCRPASIRLSGIVSPLAS